ncbi:MAG: hypothetical protein JW959_15040 [Pirellulales bacterium]|nr:hypothetical protein [Pirellulales bacterium]
MKHILTLSCTVALFWTSIAAAARVELSVRPKEGDYGVRAAVSDVGTVAGARLGLDIDGRTLWADAAGKAAWNGPASGRLAPGETATAVYEFDEPKIAWSVEFNLSADGAMASIRSEIHNRGEKTVKLGRCRLLDVAGDDAEFSLGEKPERTVMLVMSGCGSKSLLRTIAATKGPLTAKTLAPLYNSAAPAGAVVGFTSFDRINTEVQAAWSAEAKKVELRAYCDFEGYELAPGRSVASERLAVYFSRDPQDAMASWADAAAARYKPRTWPDDKIPAGWLGWSWVDPFNVERYEDVLRRNAGAIGRRLPGFDIEYVWVSIGNLKDFLPGNWGEWNSDSFPTPPERLIEDLRRQGFKFGLWMGAFWICTQADSQRLADLGDALLLYKGKPVMVPYRWQFGKYAKMPVEQRPGMYVLDPTHPKTQAYLKKVFETYYRWGVRYYMIDFLDGISGSTPGHHPYDQCHDRGLIHGPEVFRIGLKLLRESAGPDTYLLSGTGPTIQNIGLVDAARVGSDYGEGRPLAPGSGFYPGTFVINRPTFWTSHRTATDTLATTNFLHRKFFFADSGNVLTVDKPCPLAEAQISATVFGINGSPMMLGDDIDRMADERLAMVKKCLPRLPEAARSLDLFECPEPDYPKLFHLPVEAAWDRWNLVALFNYDSSPRTEEVDLKRLGLDPDGEYAVWDFWNERFDETCRGKVRLTAGPQSVKLVRLSRRRPHPWLVSTDMHVRQGQAEIEDCRWDSESMTLHFRARRPAGERGNVFLLVPPGWEAAEPRSLWLAKDGRRGSQTLIVRCALDFSDGAEERSIRFARY